MSQVIKIEKIFKTQQARRFHIVANEKSLEHIGEILGYLKSKPIKYLLCRKGLNKKGKEHAHIYVFFTKPVRLSSKSTFGCHLAKARGDSKQNYTYICDHHPELLYEEGTLPDNDGDEPPKTWDKFVEDLNKGIVDDNSMFYARYQSFADRKIVKYRKYHDYNYQGNLKDKNVWIYGPRGTYKTTAATEAGRYYEKDKSQWWDGYDGEHQIVIEEMSPDDREFASYLKRWTDKKGFQGWIKGGSTWIPGTCYWVITSNYTIDQCFNRTDADALKRRFTILYFDKDHWEDVTE